MTNGHPLIQVKNLDLYFGAFHALKNVSVDFHAGELVGLVGDNGAGKTTLIRVLCGMHTPTSGEVYFDGQRVEKFHPKLSIARNFYLGREPVRRILGIPFLDFTTMRDKSTRVIRQFGLRDNVSADDEVERLSGGERQSVKIGRAVEFRNRVVIMDEPTNHLSVREREHVNELAVQLKKQGLLVIYITHDIFQVHKLADRIVIMENGEKIEDASTSKMTAEQLEEVIRQGGRVVERREALS
jgi:simple sugar transport system ATP-binding protein